MDKLVKAAASALILLATTGGAGAGETTVEQLTVAGEQRTFRLHIPDRAAGPMPLVLSFHGYKSSALEEEMLTGFSDLAEREGFVVAYPQGIGAKWHFMGFGHADVAFAEAIVDAVADKVEIDRRRVYANGISNGAQMSWRLACNASDVFAAFGFVAGGYTEVCGKGDRPPIILFHGTADRLLPYDGRSFFMPVRKFARGWAARDGCKVAEAGEVIYRHGDATGELWRCQEGGAVVLYTLDGKGHSWPGSAMPARISSRDVDATAAMWDFFAAHSLR